MFEFTIKSGEMTAWSRQHNSVLQHSRGHPLFHKVVWLQYDAKRPDKLLVADHQTLCIVDKLPATVSSLSPSCIHLLFVNWLHLDSVVFIYQSYY